ncbi:MAG: hypothetical protein BWX48_01690 [Verrucomicrobia bacterium ADurb.Bin006]|nr:MAG: hypothetical protein BWX48_01690 [Verrucomicrobia bacterium ADurb.Bin006]
MSMARGPSLRRITGDAKTSVPFTSTWKVTEPAPIASPRWVSSLFSSPTSAVNLCAGRPKRTRRCLVALNAMPCV